MINSDFDDESVFPKDTPLKLMMKEDLALHSVEALEIRLLALENEITRTKKAIAEKRDAKKSAESFFK
ncbi:MAG: DUF1192 family protein [Emcibacter sp.]|nr:DUF1192 family protein [Emcibacter sp.]